MLADNGVRHSGVRTPKGGSWVADAGVAGGLLLLPRSWGGGWGLEEAVVGWVGWWGGVVAEEVVGWWRRGGVVEEVVPEMSSRQLNLAGMRFLARRRERRLTTAGARSWSAGAWPCWKTGDARLEKIRFDSIRLDWIRLDWVRLDQIRSDQMDQIRLDWIGFDPT